MPSPKMNPHSTPQPTMSFSTRITSHVLTGWDMVDKTTMINTYLSPSTPNQAHPILIPAYPPRHFIPTTKTHTRPKASPPPWTYHLSKLLHPQITPSKFIFHHPRCYPNPRGPDILWRILSEGTNRPMGTHTHPIQFFHSNTRPKKSYSPQNPPRC